MGKGQGKGEGKGRGSGGMLSAQKMALEKGLAQDLVSLQQKELDFYYNNNSSIGTMATLLAGFAYSAIDDQYQDDFSGYESESYNFLLIYYSAAVISVCFTIMCATCSVFLNIHGSNLALRGPDGSLMRAVLLMREYQDLVLFTFASGIASFLVMVCAYGWVLVDEETVATVLSVLVCLFASILCVMVLTILSAFKFDEKSIAGVLDSNSLARNMLSGGMMAESKEAANRKVTHDSVRTAATTSTSQQRRSGTGTSRRGTSSASADSRAQTSDGATSGDDSNAAPSDPMSDIMGFFGASAR